MPEQTSDDVVIDLDVTQETAEDSFPLQQPQRRLRGNRPPRKILEETKDQMSDRDSEAESSH